MSRPSVIPAADLPRAEPDAQDSWSERAVLSLWVAIWGPPLGDLMPLLDEHLQFMSDLEDDGSLFASGPFTAPGGPGAIVGTGMTILRAGTQEEAEMILRREPMCSAGLRTFEIRPWLLMEGSFAVRVRYSQRNHTVE